MEKEIQTEDFVHTKIISLQIPKNIDFGYCPVQWASEKFFKLHNYSQAPAAFSFDPCFFAFEPASGLLLPQKSIIVRVSCSNAEAKVVIAKTNLRVEGEEPACLKLSAIFKYPHIQLSAETLDFGSLLVGDQASQRIELLNPSDVPARFAIGQVFEDNFEDRAISCSEQAGVIPPGRSFVLTFTFKPTIPEFTSSSKFEVGWVGGAAKSLQVRGHSKKIFGRFNEGLLNFGAVRQGGSAVREFTFFNEVKRELCFEFINVGGAFAVDRPRGTIPELGHLKLKVSFRPETPANFYQKVYCLIKDQDMLSLELCGSCYDLMQRPLEIEGLLEANTKARQMGATGQDRKTFASRSGSLVRAERPKLPAIVDRRAAQKHAMGESKASDLFTQIEARKRQLGDNQQGRERTGLETSDKNLTTFKAFEKENEALNKLAQTKGFRLKPKHRAPENAEQLAEDNPLLSTVKATLVTGAAVGRAGKWATFETLFHEEATKHSLFSFSQPIFDFGTVDPTPGQPLTLEMDVRNNHPTKTLYFFFILKKTSFELDRDFLALEPGQQQTVRISFAPNVAFKFFYKKVNVIVCSELPRHIDEWTNPASRHSAKRAELLRAMLRGSSEPSEIVITDYRVLLLGNTFIDNTQPFIPMLTLEPAETLLFQPCRVDDCSFQSLMVTNRTDTPCIFKIDKITGPYQVYPLAGFIDKHSFTNLLIRFCPAREAIFTERLVIRFNLNYKRTVVLKGYCLFSELEIENEGRVYFPPCHVGVGSEVSCTLRNKGRMPIQVSVAVPPSYQRELTVHPAALTLAENESKRVSLRFIPLKRGPYKIRCPVVAESQGGAEEGRRHCLTVLGEGGDGDIVFESKRIDFGIVMVNFVQRKRIVIRNKSEVTFNVAVRLCLEDERADLSGPRDAEISRFFALDFEEGVIPAKSFKEVNIIFHPKEICSANLWLVLLTKPTGGLENPEEFREMEHNTLISAMSHSRGQPPPTASPKPVGTDSPARRSPADSAKGPWNINLNGLLRPKGQLVTEIEDSQLVSSNLQAESEPPQPAHVSQLRLKALGFTVKDKCEVAAKANYPLLKIVDIRNEELSVASLWEKFQVSEINAEFAKRLSEYEKRSGLNFRRLFDELADGDAGNRKFTWDFGFTHSNSSQATPRPRTVILFLQNIGGTDLEWRLKENDEAYLGVQEQPGDQDSSAELSSYQPRNFQKGGDKRRAFAIRPK